METDEATVKPTTNVVGDGFEHRTKKVRILDKVRSFDRRVMSTKRGAAIDEETYCEGCVEIITPTHMPWVPIVAFFLILTGLAQCPVSVISLMQSRMLKLLLVQLHGMITTPVKLRSWFYTKRFGLPTLSKLCY
jgi:hypothetical protein